VASTAVRRASRLGLTWLVSLVPQRWLGTSRKTRRPLVAKSIDPEFLSQEGKEAIIALSVKDSAVLLVAEKTDASSTLAAAVRERDQGRRSSFTLLVPAVARGFHRIVDPEDECCDEAERTISSLRSSIEAAANAPISTMIGSHEPLAAIEDALNLQDFDEIILATRSSRLARWVRLDLASKVKALGLPVTVVGL
jgi:hypothetical protein